MDITGNGYFIWQIKRIGNLAAAAARAKSAGLQWVTIKVTDGNGRFNIDPDTKKDLVPDAVAAFKAVGIQVWGWGYVYGYDPDGEAAVAVKRVNDLDLAGWIIDAEAEYKNKFTQASLYMGAMRTRLPNTPLAICAFRYPELHPEFPWKHFLTADINMPQVYWMQSQNAGAQLRESYKQFQKLTKIPFVPIGAAFGEAGWIPTTDSIKEFSRTAQDMGLPACGWWEWYDATHIYPDMWPASTLISQATVTEHAPAEVVDPEPVEPETTSQEAKGLTFVTLVDDLNIRTGPGLSYPRVGKLDLGEVVTALDVNGTSAWVKIADGQWVCRSLNGTSYLAIK